VSLHSEERNKYLSQGSAACVTRLRSSVTSFRYTCRQPCIIWSECGDKTIRPRAKPLRLRSVCACAACGQSGDNGHRTLVMDPNPHSRSRIGAPVTRVRPGSAFPRGKCPGTGSVTSFRWHGHARDDRPRTESCDSPAGAARESDPARPIISESCDSLRERTGEEAPPRMTCGPRRRPSCGFPARTRCPSWSPSCWPRQRSCAGCRCSRRWEGPASGAGGG